MENKKFVNTNNGHKPSTLSRSKDTAKSGSFINNLTEVTLDLIMMWAMTESHSGLTLSGIIPSNISHSCNNTRDT